ncbi:MAG: metallopeptidase family protein [Acidobacteriota bacterium]|nr:metallopeptidase family protein [Acidobacteriota bacterium]
MDSGDRSKDARLDAAYDALEDGDADGALATARNLLTEHATDPDVLLLAGAAHAELGELEESESHLRLAVAADPHHPGSRSALAELLFSTCRFTEAGAETARLLDEAPDDPHGHDLASRLAERRGDREKAAEEEREAHRLDPESFPLAPHLSRTEFDRCVEAALGELPDLFRARLTNLAISVADVPADDVLHTLDDPTPDLLGLYVGIPLPERQHTDLPGPPDTIFLFKRNLERMCTSRDELVGEIRVTLLHEIGHFLGLDEEQIAEAGYD